MVFERVSDKFGEESWDLWKKLRYIKINWLVNDVFIFISEVSI